MQLNNLKRTLLDFADSAYPQVAILEIENAKIIGLPEYSLDQVAIALKELEDEDLIKQGSLQISCMNEITITGNLEITFKGRSLLKVS